MSGRIARPILVLLVSVIPLLLILTTSCITIRIPSKAAEQKMASLTANDPAQPLIEDIEGVGRVSLELTYPVGPSPKVFTTGWIFGAKCLINAGAPDQKDISDQVRWSGSGTFNPSTGKTSRPVFNNVGNNTIVLSVTVGKKTLTDRYTVDTLSPAKFACVGSTALCPADHHGCPACPHLCIGPVISGCPDILINNKPAVCVGDKGTHSICCGSNTFEVVGGNPLVLIYGKRAAEIGSATKHCGGMGSIISLGHGLESPTETPQPPAESTSSKLPVQSCSYVTFSVITHFNGIDYWWGQRDIPVTWSGNSFTGRFSGPNKYPTCSRCPVTCSISGTVAADGKTVATCTYRGEIDYGQGSVTRTNFIISNLPHFPLKVEIDGSKIHVSYKVKGPDCTKYISTWDAVSVSPKGSVPIPPNFKSTTHIIEIQFQSDTNYHAN